MVFNATFYNISVFIVVVSFIGEGQTLSLNAISSTPRLSRIRTHNVSADSH